MKNLVHFLVGIILLPSCNSRIKELDKFDTTSLSISLKHNDSIEDIADIDKNVRIVLIIDGDEKPYSPINGKITLPIPDTIPDFRIEYKEFKTAFGGEMTRFEGANIFTKRATKMDINIDTYPFDYYSMIKFKHHQFNQNNYFVFVSTNSMGWSFNALEQYDIP